MNSGLESPLSVCSRYPQVAFVAAGNVTDHIGQKFVDLENVDYYGYIPQEKLLILSASAAGVFRYTHDPSVEINRLAASNKLYDAMMMGLTVITNKGIAASDFVDENRIGVVLPFDFCDQWSCLASTDLSDFKEYGANARRLYEQKFTGSGSFEGRSSKLLALLGLQE